MTTVPSGTPAPKNTDRVRQVVLDQLRETGWRGEAKRLFAVARPASYTGSERNLARSVAELKQ